MSRGQRWCLSVLLLSVFALATLGCADHHYYRAYDPYYNDYHRWNDHERVYYQQWARESHGDEHRDFRQLDKNEQKEYWTRRHCHSDQDHNHDHR